MKKIKIPIKEFSLEEVENDDRIALLAMKFMHDKENLNKSFIGLDAIKDALDNSLSSISGMPILASFDLMGKDFQEHNDDEIGIGFVPQINNGLKIEKDEDTDWNYVYVNGYIWRHYSKNAIDILEEAKDKSKSCSMEIEVLDGYRDKDLGLYVITKFKFLGITILGDDYEPAMENCNVQLNYSFNKKYAKQLDDLHIELKKYFNLKKEGENKKMAKEEFLKKEDWGTGDSITIDLSKDSADMTGSWGDVDKTKLRNDILKAKNYKTLVNSCYLMVKDGWEDNPSSKLKYPVCEISSDKLILSKDGCQTAFSMLEKNTDDPDYSTAKSQLKKYYKTLELDTSNFKKEDVKMTKKEIAQKFSLTYNQLNNELYSALSNCKFEGQDWYGDNCLMQQYYMVDYDDDFVYCYDAKDNIYVKVPYSKNNDDVSIDTEKASRIKFTPTDWEAGDTEDDDVQEEFVKKFTQELKEKYSVKKNDSKDNNIEEMQNKMNDILDKYATLEKSIKEKDTAIESLTKFKKDTEKNELQEKANKLYTKYEEYITEDEKKDFDKKLFTYEHFEDFEDKVKALVLPKVEAKMFSLSKNKKEDNPNTIDVNFMNLPTGSLKDEATSKSSVDQLKDYIQQ